MQLAEVAESAAAGPRGFRRHARGLERRDCVASIEDKARAVTAAKVERAQAMLAPAALGGIEVKSLHGVAAHVERRNARHVLMKEPLRLRFEDDAAVFAEEFDTLPVRLAATSGAEILTRQAADDARKFSAGGGG